MGFCYGKFSLLFTYFPTSWDVKYGSYVATYTFLVGDDFFLADLNFAIYKYLICTTVSHDCAVVIEELVKSPHIDYLLAEPLLVDVAIGDYRLAAEYVLESSAGYGLV